MRIIENVPSPIKMVQIAASTTAAVLITVISYDVMNELYVEE